MIYILTGDIRTGKTTALLDWCKNRNDVDGVLCPDDEKGKRYFLNIKSKDTYPLAANSDTKDHNIISIGPFQFLKSSFQNANDYLLKSNDQRDYLYLVVDELGKLELKNIGLHDSAKSIIAQHKNRKSHHLILVVRESLLNDIIEHYQIYIYEVINKEDLESL
ncbi:nucleoside-triphosphatase [uncultured Winogradskyella sp.]|uniref:nucleoside-triphosphatase n=1 Tax=uncultured Winogradskyella sp. TaxID=395353 RepID=UPI0030D8FFF8|tara:strand:+ start:817 stop:1305 length:489 start_codon:yes stop_codon:yes gene_type:complete